MVTVLKFQPEKSSHPADDGELESEVRSYCRRFDVTFAQASGSYLSDDQGRRYIDFLAGCSSLNYGHNDPDMMRELVGYLQQNGIAHGLDFRTTAKMAFMESFRDLILRPRGLDYRLQFTGPTGTNAVEAALKLARKVTGRSEIISFTRGFHGMTLGALAATGNTHHRLGGTLSLPGVSRAFYDGYFGPDIDTADMLERTLSDPSSGVAPPAAFIVETVQGEGGLSMVSARWLQRLAALARRFGSLLIIDDIQAGCGRTGNFFSFEPLGVAPDIVVMAKSLSGFGLPMALLLMRPELDQWRPGEHNGTFRGNNLAFLTARVALEKFWSNDVFARDVARKSDLLAAALTQTAALVPGARVKGRGMMQGIEFSSGEFADAVIRKCFTDGLVIETSGPNDEVVKVLAPLTTPDEVLAEGLAILRRAVEGEARRVGMTK